MENYKKLLELLRSDPDCDTCGFEECNHNSCLLEVRSADAIENLLTENAVLRKQADDLTKAGLIATDKANQAIAKMHETRSELDAAVRGQETLQNALEEVKADRDVLRNELCCKCGNYREAHNGACDGCRWKKEC